MHCFFAKFKILESRRMIETVRQTFAVFLFNAISISINLYFRVKLSPLQTDFPFIFFVDIS